MTIRCNSVELSPRQDSCSPADRDLADGDMVMTVQRRGGTTWFDGYLPGAGNRGGLQARDVFLPSTSSAQQ